MGHRFRALTVMMVCALATLASACGPVVKNPTSLEQSAAITAPAREQLYLLSPGDKIDVRFFYNPDLNDSVTVRPEGRIYLPLANEVPAAGKHVHELTQYMQLRREGCRGREGRSVSISVVVEYI